jgi:acid phosphatase family membrane protein YuiD
MGSIIANLFMDNIFLSILLAGSISQLVKIVIFKYKFHEKFHFNDLIVTGGMPSTHSALVSSLTAIIWLKEGFSPLFFAVLTFSFIVLRDSIGVRRSVGEEGKMIEKIIKHDKISTNKFHYSLGHNPLEVFVGLLIGFGSAVFSYIFI